MIKIATAGPYLLTLFCCVGLSYGQVHSPPVPRPAVDPKLYPREVTDLPNFVRYDYYRSPRDPFLDKSVKTTIMGEFKANVLDKLVLVSWLDDAGKIAIFVQNTETNDVQKVTSEPNKDHFRIVEIHPNSDPNLFEAVISNGTEKGPVKFRLTPPDLKPQTRTASPTPIPAKNRQIWTINPPAALKRN
jgi:hypothetical protein